MAKVKPPPKWYKSGMSNSRRVKQLVRKVKKSTSPGFNGNYVIRTPKNKRV